jgi:carbon-monoxide dehydrogenase small subunit
METNIQFILNKKNVQILIDSRMTLLWILRTHFGLTGTKYGCGEGYCGSCTVLINNEPVRSCQVSINHVKGKEVTTIEGLSHNDDLHPLQKAFIKHDALQCGYCTPGMILNAAGFLNKNPNPSRSEIIDEMDDNLCRCGSYNRIIDAIQSAAIELGSVKSSMKK